MHNCGADLLAPASINFACRRNHAMHTQYNSLWAHTLVHCSHEPGPALLSILLGMHSQSILFKCELYTASVAGEHIHSHLLTDYPCGDESVSAF